MASIWDLEYPGHWRQPPPLPLPDAPSPTPTAPPPPWERRSLVCGRRYKATCSAGKQVTAERTCGGREHPLNHQGLANRGKQEELEECQAQDAWRRLPFRTTPLRLF